MSGNWTRRDQLLVLLRGLVRQSTVELILMLHATSQYYKVALVNQKSTLMEL
jgi:hypothetical protein